MLLISVNNQHRNAILYEKGCSWLKVLNSERQCILSEDPKGNGHLGKKPFF